MRPEPPAPPPPLRQLRSPSPPPPPPEAPVPRVVAIGDSIHVLDPRSNEWVPAQVDSVTTTAFGATDQRGRVAKYALSSTNWVPQSQRPPRRVKPATTTVPGPRTAPSSSGRRKERMRVLIRQCEESDAADVTSRDEAHAETLRRRVEERVEPRLRETTVDLARALRNLARRERRKRAKQAFVAAERNRRRQLRQVCAERESARLLRALEAAAHEDSPADRLFRGFGSDRCAIHVLEGSCAVAINAASGEQVVFRGPLKRVLEPCLRVVWGPAPEARSFAAAPASAATVVAKVTDALALEAKRELAKLEELLASGLVSETEFGQRRRALLKEMGAEGRAILDAEASKVRAEEEKAAAAAAAMEQQQLSPEALKELERKEAKRKRKLAKKRRKRKEKKKKIREERRLARAVDEERARSMRVAVPRSKFSARCMSDAIQDAMSNRLDSRIPDRW